MIEFTQKLATSISLDIVLIVMALVLSLNARRRLFSGFWTGGYVSVHGSPVKRRRRVVLFLAGIVVAAVVARPVSAYVVVARGSESLSHRVITFVVLFLGSYAVLKLFLMVKTWRDQRNRMAVALAAKGYSARGTAARTKDGGDQVVDSVAGAAENSDNSTEDATDETTDTSTGCLTVFLFHLVPSSFFDPSAFGITTGITSVVAAALLVGPLSAHMVAATGSEPLFWHKIIILLGLFVATYAVLKLPESHMQQIGVATGRATEPRRYRVLLLVYSLTLGIAEAAAIGAILIAGMRAQPWVDYAEVFERSVAARVAEHKLGIGPALFR